MKKTNVKRIVVSSLLVAVAVTLSITEKIFPIGAIVPVPGIKLGLANVVTMMALFYIGPLGAWTILVVRCLLGGLFSGVISMLFSLTGGTFAFFAMLLTKKFYGKTFSIYGVSMAGAAFHNVGQILAASVLLGENLLRTYLPILLFAGLGTGILTAAVAGPLFTKLERNGFIVRYLEGSYYFSSNN
ncbi:MAG: Gx transporter family protein [Christensenellales bacterium]|jgi:heptaprenyl diphosphate synthase